MLLRSEMNYGNIQLRITLKWHVEADCFYGPKCNYGNNRLCNDAGIIVGCLLERSEMNYGNIQLRMMLQ